MRLSIIAILISLSAIGYGQQDSIGFDLQEGWIIIDQHDMASSEDTLFYWPVAIGSDTIKDGERIELRAGRGMTIMDHGGIQPVGRITPYEVWNKPYSSSVAELLELYDQYLESRTTYSGHPDGHFDDCEMEWKSEQGPGEMTVWEECINPDHQKEFPVKSSFEGFIKWLKEQ